MIESSLDLLEKFSRRLLETHSTQAAPLIIGLNGPQGCGKTTLANKLMEFLRTEGKIGITLSIDDFYLTRNDQIELAKEHHKNTYLQQRGYPGTHDIPLGTQTLSALREINRRRSPVRIPRYDKSLFGGKGDRRPESEWPEVSAPLDLVLLEGWMLGFRPVGDETIADASMREINIFLKEYQTWHDYLDAFVVIEAEDIEYTIGWRIEAEQNMRKQGKSGMSDAEIRSYIGKFIPAYKLFRSEILRNPCWVGKTLIITIDKNRRPVKFSEP